ncbi:hypothetical protein BJV78DRAFT_185929 [Lactifluus subvellereus]|nr:hypothetical protein BJV78DRAFT_185929 [Lactifluus subvellereus]
MKVTLAMDVTVGRQMMRSVHGHVTAIKYGHRLRESSSLLSMALPDTRKWALEGAFSDMRSPGCQGYRAHTRGRSAIDFDFNDPNKRILPGMPIFPWGPLLGCPLLYATRQWLGKTKAHHYQITRQTSKNETDLYHRTTHSLVLIMNPVEDLIILCHSNCIYASPVV